MNELKKLAIEAGLFDEDGFVNGEYNYDEEVKKFAELVAAAEREACAQEAENRWLDKAHCTAEEMYEMQKKSIAAAIRARREQ